MLAEEVQYHSVNVSETWLRIQPETEVEVDHSQHTQRWFVRGRVHVVTSAAEVEDQYQHSQCWLEQEDSRDVISLVEVEQQGDTDSLDAQTSRLVKEGLAAAIGRRRLDGA